MFDVLWTDPNRENVGERILRKELEGKTKGKDKTKPGSGRSSVSTNASSSSERGLGILSGKHRGKARDPAHSPSREATASALLFPSDVDSGNRTSTYGVRALLSNHATLSSSSKVPHEGPHHPVQLHDPEDAPSSPSSRDSVVSKWTQHSGPAIGSSAGVTARDSMILTRSEHLIQALGPSSFITRSTEVTVAPRDPEKDVDHEISEVHISADRNKAGTPPMPELTYEAIPPALEESGAMLPFSHWPKTPPPVDIPYNTHTGWNTNASVGSPDAWKPPQDWNCTPSKDKSNLSGSDKSRMPPLSPEAEHRTSAEIVALQREVRMMAQATPELLLSNLRSGLGELSDATGYKEMEMAKKRWLFTALHRHGVFAELAGRVIQGPESPMKSRPPQILALYETQASASFLAASYPRIPLTHLSPSPLSPSLYRNVKPIFVPAISASAGALALPPQLYSEVTCLFMPALFPSTEIPPFLRSIYKCLRPGGALHLTLVDPQPMSGTMGPKTRQWFFEKLLINLEQNFRTTYPCDTFPAWLGVAKLRGKGSTIAKMTVPAVPDCLTKMDGMPDQAIVKTELHCLATRMLWQEVWGKYCLGERWWWEEDELVQECLERETSWEYSLIVAVKEEKRTKE